MKIQYTNKMAIAALAALLATGTAGCATVKPNSSIDSKASTLQNTGYIRSIKTPYGELRAPNGRNIGVDLLYDSRE